MTGSTAPFTYRCTICGINWPYYEPYRTCRKCNEPCSPLQLPPADVDEILTFPEARELALSGRDLVEALSGREPTPDEVSRLHAALDDWSHRRPSWMR